MPGAAEQVVHRRALDDAAEIHHRHLARDMLDHGEVVADEQIGEAELAPELVEQVEDLRLHGDVERGGRLVADHDARPQHERARDGDALALPAGELLGEPRRHLRREADAGEHLRHALAPLRGRDALRGERQGDDVGDAVARVERGIRVLEHRLDHARALLPVHVGEPPPVDQHAAGDRLQQAEDDARERRLAAAGFADDRP